LINLFIPVTGMGRFAFREVRFFVIAAFWTGSVI
jgi:hypothetical protein